MLDQETISEIAAKFIHAVDALYGALDVELSDEHAARVVGGIVCVFTTLMLLVGTQAAPSAYIAKIMLSVPVIPWIGYLVAFFRPREGGWIMIAGSLVAAVGIFLATTSDGEGWFGPVMIIAGPFALAGVCFLIPIAGGQTSR